MSLDIYEFNILLSLRFIFIRSSSSYFFTFMEYMCHFSQGECWCEDEPITDCTCNKGGGCPQGQYGKHAGRELCGYEEGYEDTYFSATEEAAQAYKLNNSPS